MTSAGFDQNLTVFSPEGRLYQIEYANTAVQQSPLTSLALKTSSSLLFASQLPTFDLLQNSKNTTFIHQITPTILLLTAGRSSDSRQLVQRVRSEVTEYRKRFMVQPSVQEISERIADVCQVYSQEAWLRPYGVCLYFGCSETLKIYKVDPSGSCFSINCGASGAKGGEFLDYFCQQGAENQIESGIEFGLGMYQKYVNAGLIGDDVEVWEVIDRVWVKKGVEEVDDLLERNKV